MASKRKLIRLVSTGTNEKGKKTGYFKTTLRNDRVMDGKKKEKLDKMCFDPRAYNPETGKTGRHVLFEEKKDK